MQHFDGRRRLDREREFIPLEVPVPPGAAQTFGYRGGARFVAFYWEPAGDEVVYDDGQLSGTGASYVFLTYRRHPAVEPHLGQYNLGDSDLEATHCLIMDRETGRAGVATRAAARAFLAGQHPPPPELSPHEFEEARKLLREAVSSSWREFTIGPEAVRAALVGQQLAVARMVAYLDRFTPPRGPGSPASLPRPSAG